MRPDHGLASEWKGVPATASEERSKTTIPKVVVAGAEFLDDVVVLSDLKQGLEKMTDLGLILRTVKIKNIKGSGQETDTQLAFVKNGIKFIVENGLGSNVEKETVGNGATNTGLTGEDDKTSNDSTAEMDTVDQLQKAQSQMVPKWEK